MTAHKDIRIEFEIDGRRFEAVGFLAEGENSVSGDEMIRRTANENNGGIGEDDYLFLSKKRRDKFPEELRQYCLITNRRYPDAPHYVSRFKWDGGEWLLGWSYLNHYEWDKNFKVLSRRCDYQWKGNFLVIRRRA